MDQSINFNVNATTAQAVQALDGVTKSVVMVTDAAGKLNRQVFALADGTMGYKDASGMFIKTTLDQTAALQRLNETTRRGAMVGLSFNRIVQDAGYFGQSAAMGFMAVGNNITYFAEQMSFAKQQGLSMMGVLKGMLTGVNAWMFGINLAVSAITFFTMSQWKSKTAVDENTSAIKRQKEELDGLREALEQWEKDSKDVGLLMRNLNKGELDALTNEKTALLINIELQKNKIKQVDPKGTDFRAIQTLPQQRAILDAYYARLATVNDALGLMNAQFGNIENSSSKAGGAIKNVLDSLSPLQQKIFDLFNDKQNKLIKDQADELFRIAEVWGKMPKFGEGAGGLIIPNQNTGTNFQRPDTAGYLQDYEDKKAKKDAALYKSTLREFSSIGSNLRTIFKDAGDSFLNSMIESLSVVTAILEIVQSIQAIMTFLDLLKTGASIAAAPATGGASLLGSGIVPSIVGGQGANGSPSQIIIPISIGDQPLQTIIIDTTKKAQRLRYLN